MEKIACESVNEWVVAFSKKYKRKYWCNSRTNESVWTVPNVPSLQTLQTSTSEVFAVPPQTDAQNKFFLFPKELKSMLTMVGSEQLELYMRDENMQIATNLNEYLASKASLFVLQGPPGVGKTTAAVKWMVDKIAFEANDMVCAWIRLETGGSYSFNVYVLQTDVEQNNMRLTKTLVTGGESVLALMLVEIEGMRVIVLDRRTRAL